MKSIYTFKATPRDTDFVRICRENHQARFIVVKSEGGQTPLTFIRIHSSEHVELRNAALTATARIEVPPVKATPDRAGRVYLIFDGDHSKLLEPKVLTTVEAYS